MFEQATLSNGPAGKRVWTTFLGVGSQVALVSLAVLAPMVWPQTLPIARFWESLTPPLPPGPKPLGGETAKRPVRTLKAWNQTPSWRVAPAAVPDHIDMTEAPPVATVPGAHYGDPSARGNDLIGPMLNELAATTSRLMPPTPPTPVKPVEKPAAVEAPPLRLRQGGEVHLGRPISKTQPVYPPLAIQTRASGDVVLECVVGTDGRIHDVKVKSGHPLLIRAAVDAARQWVYEPSQLNGTLIEIIAEIKVSFKLN